MRFCVTNILIKRGHVLHSRIYGVVGLQDLTPLLLTPDAPGAILGRTLRRPPPPSCADLIRASTHHSPSLCLRHAVDDRTKSGHDDRRGFQGHRGGSQNLILN